MKVRSTRLVDNPFCAIDSQERNSSLAFLPGMWRDGSGPWCYSSLPMVSKSWTSAITLYTAWKFLALGLIIEIWWPWLEECSSIKLEPISLVSWWWRLAGALSMQAFRTAWTCVPRCTQTEVLSILFNFWECHRFMVWESNAENWSWSWLTWKALPSSKMRRRQGRTALHCADRWWFYKRLGEAALSDKLLKLDAKKWSGVFSFSFATYGFLTLNIWYLA